MLRRVDWYLFSDVSGQPIGSFFKGLTLIMEPIGCPETSANNYQYRLSNIPEDLISHLHRSRSLKSRILASFPIGTLHAYLFFSMRATCPGNLTTDLIILFIFGKDKNQDAPHQLFLPPVTSSLLHLYVFLSIVFCILY
jgi:hypothetical protein